MSVYVDVHISICAHMCEMNIRDICSCVYVYIQMGIYITLFAYVHVCTCVYAYVCNILMMLVCVCINACTCKYICVFDHTCVCVDICLYVGIFVCMLMFNLFVSPIIIC